jgi:ATP-binding cassette subfamily F protein 3
MWERGQVMGHLGRVQFSGDEVRRMTASLSGGELARVALARMMLSGANFLIFDEPTNHLDVESIEALEDAIERFDGTVLLVSHDRELLRKLVTRVWELRDGVMRVFDGDFASWEEARAEELTRASSATERVASAQREKDQPRRQAANSARGQPAGRDVKRALEQAEARVGHLDAKVADLTAQLADPALYATPDGPVRAEAMAREIEDLRAELSGAIREWELAMEALTTTDG